MIIEGAIPDLMEAGRGQILVFNLQSIVSVQITMVERTVVVLAASTVIWPLSLGG